MNALSARPARVASQRNVQQPIRSPRLAAAPRSATPRKSTTTCSLIVAGVPIPVPEMAEGPPYGIYAALGASAASFVGTFFVAPQFKDQFKQDEDWNIICEKLRQAKVESVDPTEALLKRRGTVILDVRNPRAQSRAAIPGAVSAPLYRSITGFAPAQIVRRLAFIFFGVEGTERDPDWLSNVEAQVKKNQEIYVICENGGSLVSRPGVPTGFQSRSLKAVYFLREAGFTRVKHLKGGIFEWNQRGLPLDVPGDE